LSCTHASAAYTCSNASSASSRPRGSGHRRAPHPSLGRWPLLLHSSEWSSRDAGWQAGWKLTPRGRFLGEAGGCTLEVAVGGAGCLRALRHGGGRSAADHGGRGAVPVGAGEMRWDEMRWDEMRRDGGWEGGRWEARRSTRTRPCTTVHVKPLRHVVLPLADQPPLVDRTCHSRQQCECVPPRRWAAGEGAGSGHWALGTDRRGGSVHCVRSVAPNRSWPRAPRASASAGSSPATSSGTGLS
jgi:hypothetical protein